MEDEEYCVFRQLGAILVSAARGCADKYYIDLKSFYNITDTGCIVCKNLGRDEKEIDCFEWELGNKPYGLAHNEMFCFCKKDQCNQYEYKDDLRCEKTNYTFNPLNTILEMELCLEIVVTAATNADVVSTQSGQTPTHLDNQNRTEFDGITAITQSHAATTMGETKVDGTTEKQGNQAETETGGSKSTIKPNTLQYSIVLFSIIKSILKSIFAM